MGAAGRVAWGSPRSPVRSGGTAFLSFLLLEISLEKLSTVFLPEKKEKMSQSMGGRGLEPVQLGPTPAATVATVALSLSCFLRRPDTP